MKQWAWLLILLLPLFYQKGIAQTGIQLGTDVDPLLKRVAAKTPGLKIFGRRNAPGSLVNMAVLNENDRRLYWFTCYGKAFDSVRLNDNEYKLVATGAIDPFTFYRHCSYQNLHYTERAELHYRLFGKEALLDTTHNFRPVFDAPQVRAAQSTLQKLLAIELQMKKICLQLALFDGKAARLAGTGHKNVAGEKFAGRMIRRNGHIEFYNTDPHVPASKILLDYQSPDKLFVYNLRGALIDSVPLKPAKFASLLKEKQDVFLLYRGWLELQWQQVVSGRQHHTAWLNRIDSGLYTPVSWDRDMQQLQSLAADLKTWQTVVNNKIVNLIVPDKEQVERMVAHLYRNEQSEISYLPGLGFSYTLAYKRGNKLYELTDPRGNVMATVTDRKTGTDENSDGLIEYYNADAVSAQDYYPFGAQMPGRRAGEDGKYRYGYNGKENDNEVKGAGNQQDYGARVYDSRLGRFLSMDPLSKSFPWYSPYQFAGNMPIAAVDLDGEEQKIIINWHDANGKVTKTKLIRGDFDNVNKLYQSLSAGLNTKTTYDLEGTKFNATNAQFSQGFEAYKEGTMNPRGNHNRIRPNAGILKFDIAANPNGQPSVNISFDNVPIDKKDLTVQAMRGLSAVTGVVGQGVEGLGYVAAIFPGTQAASIPLIGVGKGLGAAGDFIDMGADALDGKYKDAGIKGGFIVVGAVAGKGAEKLPVKQLAREAVDSYVGTTTGAVRDGYFDNRVLPVEESDELNLKIEQKK